MFAGKDRAYLSGTPEMNSTVNMRLGWKGLPRTNALAYYEKMQLRAVKRFLTFSTGGSVINAATFNFL
jgi:hypothetical protein